MQASLLLSMTGEVLKRIAKENKITYDELAKRLGISKSAVTQQFNSNDLRTGSVENFCRALGLKINDLYKGTDLAVVPIPDYVGNNNVNEEVIALRGKVEVLTELLEKFMNPKEIEKETIKLANAG